MRFTILGGQGFIGSHLVKHLRGQGHETFVPARAADLSDIELGHVIYAIGLTSNFRERPHDTIVAHVSLLSDLLSSARFASWLFLSSTRVYGELSDDGAQNEDALVCLRPSADSLYDLSKLLGEARCLAVDDERVRVARLSNVYGIGQDSATFLGSVVKDLTGAREVLIRESPESAKDYVAVAFVADALTRVALAGRQRVYNVASGVQTTHATVARIIQSAAVGRVDFDAAAPTRVLAPIDVSRLQREFPELDHPSFEEGLRSMLVSK